MREKPEAGRHRSNVDRGQTHDKIAARDPAAAPEHTDAEASGPATSAAASDASNEMQRRQHVSDVPRSDHTTPGRGQGQIPGHVSAWLMGTGIAALALLGAGAAYLSVP